MITNNLVIEHHICYARNHIDTLLALYTLSEPIKAELLACKENLQNCLDWLE